MWFFFLIKNIKLEATLRYAPDASLDYLEGYSGKRRVVSRVYLVSFSI